MHKPLFPAGRLWLVIGFIAVVCIPSVGANSGGILNGTRWSDLGDARLQKKGLGRAAIVSPIR